MVKSETLGPSKAPQTNPWKRVPEYNGRLKAVCHKNAARSASCRPKRSRCVKLSTEQCCRCMGRPSLACCRCIYFSWYKAKSRGRGLTGLTDVGRSIRAAPNQFVWLLFCFLRQGPSLYPWLSQNLLFRPGWPQTHRNPPDSASQMFRLKVWATTSRICIVFFSPSSLVY